jgi:aldose 1-epimerase
MKKMTEDVQQTLEHERYVSQRMERNGIPTVCLKDLHEQAEAELVPDIGANVFRYRVGEHDILLSPPDMDALRKGSSLYGFPILFPPSRIRHGAFSCGGKEYRFPLNFGPHHIHGELREISWRLLETGADPERGAYAVCEVHVGELERMHAYYPHALRFRLTVSLFEGNLHLEGSIVNEGNDAAPLGFGFHPYFAFKPEEAGTVSIQVPAVSEYLIDPEGFFTGPLHVTEVCGQLFGGMKVSDLPKDSDHRVVKLHPDRRSFIVNRPGSGIRLTCDFSREFGFAFLFVPPWGDAISIEPVSSVTDAFQLPYPAEETGVRVLEAGERFDYAVHLHAAALL